MANVLFVILFALVSGFFAGVESGAYRLNRIRLRQRAKAGSRTARLLEGMVADMEEFVSVTLVGTNASVYAATLFCTALLRDHFKAPMMAEFASTLMLAPLLLLIAEILPKSLFQMLSDPLMRWASPVLWCCRWALWPVVKMLRGMVGLWRKFMPGRRSASRTVVTSEYLRFFLGEGRKEGVITPQQDLMVRNILQFENRPLHSVMIPLSNVSMIPRGANREEINNLIARHDHARLPVFEGERGRIVGVLLTLDYLCTDLQGNAGQNMLEPTFLKAGLPLDDAVQILQREGRTLGVVVDDEQRAVGIVTMGDLLQEIFSKLNAA